MNEIDAAERTRDVIADELSRCDLHEAARKVQTFQPRTSDFNERTEDERASRAFRKEMDERRHTRALASLALAYDRARTAGSTERSDVMFEAFWLAWGRPAGREDNHATLEQWIEWAKEAQRAEQG